MLSRWRTLKQVLWWNLSFDSKPTYQGKLGNATELLKTVEMLDPFPLPCSSSSWKLLLLLAPKGWGERASPASMPTPCGLHLHLISMAFLLVVTSDLPFFSFPCLSLLLCVERVRGMREREREWRVRVSKSVLVELSTKWRQLAWHMGSGRLQC